ncbi:hypothetical protein DRE_04490 [Drechslerella stenobrocha 248]|uniref:Uncharacterized protein n=1 Tax=Drechslerella stenobrocha 248 TaxID=1043628 RepID=W7HSS8_9PEZI|nr:hypothetical protein DRE_04490 [Drechslerella stenobrocha 248]
MLQYFPPFPSPNPAATEHSPLEGTAMLPSVSPPSSDTSSEISSARSPSSSAPWSPTYSPTSPTGKLPRSRSRSSARKCAPPHARIIKRDQQPSAGPHSPPPTPPFNQRNNSAGEEEEAPRRVGENEEEEELKKLAHLEGELARSGSLRAHYYEDAVRIACGAWCDTEAGKKPKKRVTWDKEVLT